MTRWVIYHVELKFVFRLAKLHMMDSHLMNRHKVNQVKKSSDKWSGTYGALRQEGGQHLPPDRSEGSCGHTEAHEYDSTSDLRSWQTPHTVERKREREIESILAE